MVLAWARLGGLPAFPHSGRMGPSKSMSVLYKPSVEKRTASTGRKLWEWTGWTGRTGGLETPAFCCLYQRDWLAEPTFQDALAGLSSAFRSI